MTASIPNEIKTALLIDTQSAAKALSDDLKHFREVLAKDSISAGDLRRLSTQLRRILVEQDLRKIAAPRVGKVLLNAPQLKPFHQANSKAPIDFFSGGNLKFRGIEFGSFLLHQGQMGSITSDPDELISLNVDQFIQQRVICFRGQWADRRSIIKYVCIVAHGVHSKPADEDANFRFLASIKRSASIRFEGGNPYIHLNLDVILDGTPNLKFELNEIDLALLQLMSTAQYLVSSPSVKELERIIDEE